MTDQELTPEREEELRLQYAAEHDVARIDTVAGALMIRTTTGDEGTKFFLMARAKQGEQAARRLVKACTIYPDAEEVERLLKRYFFLSDTVCTAIAKLSGLDDIDPTKK